MADVFPPPAIQTPPAGWLGFLGIKSGGRQPVTPNTQLAPTLEMFEFYLAGNRTPLAAAIVQAAATNLGTTTNPIIVPNGKVWIVEAIHSQSGAQGAASASEGMVICTDASTTLPFYIGPPSNPGVTGKVLWCRSDRRLILGPGNQIRVFTSAVAAITAFNWTTTVFGQEVSA